MNKLAAFVLIPILLGAAMVPFATARAQTNGPGLPSVKGDAYFSGEIYNDQSYWSEWYWTFSSGAQNSISMSNLNGYLWYEWTDATGTYLLIWGQISYDGYEFYYDTSVHPSGTGSILVVPASGSQNYIVAGGLSGTTSTTATKLIFAPKVTVWDGDDVYTGGGVVITISGTLYKAGEGWYPVGAASRSFVLTPSTASALDIWMYAAWGVPT